MAIRISSVLIETLWNVKSDRACMAIRISSVLIETLWNVKINDAPCTTGFFAAY